MKIGFFMGSFDPIHIGHINMIRAALAWVDKIIVVPSGHNPWKEDEPAPFKLRMEMIAAAIKPFGERVEVSDIESTFEPPFYANKPLNYFRAKFPNDNLVIICGSDTADKIPLWKNASYDILPFYRILSIEREYQGMHKSGNDWQRRWVEDPDGKKYEYEHIFIHPFPVSSTYIRRVVKEGGVTYPLIPIEVDKIIKDNNLYK